MESVSLIPADMTVTC